MAAVTKLGFLLIVLISGIHGEEKFYEIRERGGVYTFHAPKEANFCVISRSIDEENLVLWNTSVPSPENLTLPEDLKKRLEVGSEKGTLSFTIHNLAHSDSGLYREECWTDGNVTHQINTSITVCSTIDGGRFFLVNPRGTMDFPCKRARVGDNLTAQWLKYDFETSLWTRMFTNDNRSLNPLMNHLEGRLQLVENSSSLRISNIARTNDSYYTCLVMEKQQCVSSSPIHRFGKAEYIFHSVGDEAVLPCFDTDLYGPPAYWKREVDGQMFVAPPSQNHPEGFGNLTDRGQQYRHSDDPVVNNNYSLVFSSLTLSHSGSYECDNDRYMLQYFLMVCPESAPLTQFFSDGEEVTLSCSDNTTELPFWFRKTEQEEDIIFDPIVSFFVETENIELYEGFKGRLNVSLYTSIVLSNLSAEDSGEYWCAAYVGKDCKSTAKTILIYKDPFGINSTFYAVWSSLMSCGLLGMVCVVVIVTVIHRN